MEPKLFVELRSKSNRRVIANALSHCCLAGPVNEEAKHAALAVSRSKEIHILIDRIVVKLASRSFRNLSDLSVIVIILEMSQLGQLSVFLRINRLQF